MRVITGSARGRRLRELEGMETRPTTDRVKEGMFSILQFDIEGRRVLDMFAGTGQLGIECLSRGADRRGDAVRLIRENLRVTNLEAGARVIAGDAMEYLRTAKQRFDLIFLDPPYASGLLETALEEIARIDILSPHGIIVAEHPADHVLPVLAPPYRLHRVYRYGKIGLSVYHRGANQENEEQRS